MFDTIIQIAVVFYLVSFAVFMRTKNVQSFLIFRFIPFVLAFAMVVREIYNA